MRSKSLCAIASVLILLRVSFPQPQRGVDLSRKFGCEPNAVLGLIETARRLGVRVRGLSFHVGSQATEPTKYVEAIEACTSLIGEALLAGLPSLDILDIGGGYPVSYGERSHRSMNSVDRFVRRWPKCPRMCA